MEKRTTYKHPTAGTFGSASSVPIIVVDSLGRVQSVTNQAIAGSRTADLELRTHWQQVERTGAATLDAFGVGITVAAGTTSAFNDSTGVYVDYDTGTVLGNTVNWRNSNSPANFQHVPRWIFAMKTNGITNVRLWMGLTNTGTGFTDADSPPNDSAAFRFSTVAGDTNWRCFTRDTTTDNNQDSGVLVSADTRYVVMIEVDTSEVRFYINGTLVQTLSSNRPTAASSFIQGFLVANRGGGAGSDRSLRLGRMYLQTR